LKVRWLNKALRDLDHEASYLATENPAAVHLLVERIREAVAQLSDQPSLGRPGRVPGTRELVVLRTRYLLPYRVRAQTIEILRVFHTSRRPPQTW
jgi:addiction module RelE/StbE family toxin